MKNYLKHNRTNIILSFIITLLLIFLLAFGRPNGTIGVEVFFIPLWIMFWICKYIEDTKER